MSISLTNEFVKKIKVVSRRLISDAQCKGLYLDARPKSSTYRFRYTDLVGKQRVETIGDTTLFTLSEARKITKELRRKLSVGENLNSKEGLI